MSDNNDRSEKADSIIDMSSSIGGSLTGAAFSLIGGPTGYFIGPVAGSIVEYFFKKAGKEIKDRVLSQSEERKITTVYNLAAEKIKTRLSDGDQIRQDDFFGTEGTSRSKADEVFEDILFSVEKEVEEQKLEYMATLFSNIVFDSTVSKEESHQVISVARNISYRQLAILQIIIFNQYGKALFGKINPSNDSPRGSMYGTINGYHNNSVLTEVLDLYRKGIIHSSTVIFDVASINPSELIVAGVGLKLYNLMELENFPFDQVSLSVSQTFSIKD